jgi:DUF1365 family protein
MLFDLDEMEALPARLRWFSRNRFNLFSVYDADHGEGGDDIRVWIRYKLAANGVEASGGAIRLLCMPRILGYVFNPISVYFCYGRDGSVVALVYEVHNTFGQRHSYVLKATGSADDVLQAADKLIYVSPFIDMDIRYAFRVQLPGERVSVSIRADDAQAPVISTLLTASRLALDDGQLLRVFFSYPLLTLKVIGAIHWEAFRLWLKGVRVQRDSAVVNRQTEARRRSS